MIVQVLYNLEGKPATDYQMTFSDVEEGKWYTDSVTWLLQMKERRFGFGVRELKL